MNRHLQSFIDFGLITPSHRDAALAHAWAQEIKDLADPASALAWLVIRGVVPEEEFDALRNNLRQRFSGDDYHQRQRIVSEARDAVRLAKQNLALRAFIPLLEEGLIDEAQHAAALQARPVDVAFASPAAALAWMVAVAELIDGEQWQALHAGSTAERPARQQILSEADQLLDALSEASHEASHQASHQAAASAFWRGVFPGPPWLWIGGALLAVGAAAWYLVVPSSAPECNSSQITRTVNAMLFTTHIRLRSDVMRGGQNLPDSAPRLKDVREVGYAKADRVRGCLGSLEYGEDVKPYAFTIQPGGAGKSAEQRDAFFVAGATPRIVEARFGGIDAEGRFAQQAEPIGRANLEQALRAGVEAFNSSPNNAAANRLLQSVMGQRNRQRRAEAADTDRQREIAEVEPLAPCRVEAAGERCVCRLLVERNDPLLKAMGRAGSHLIEADFTFEREAGGSQWRVSEEFPREFSEAIAQARH